MSILYLFHHRLGLLRLGHVAFDQERVLQFFRHALGISLVLSGRIDHVIHHAFRAAFAKRLDQFLADSTRAAGDEDDFAGEIQWIAHIAKE